MANMNINCIRVGMIQTNCYIVSNEDTKQALVVDPGDGADFLASCMEDMEVTPVAILLTHAHFDHIQAVPELKAKYNIPIYVHEADVSMLEDKQLNMGLAEINLADDDVCLKDGDMLELAGLKIKVIHTPGHTPGGVCYYFEEQGVLLSGDTLFRCSWGRTDFPGGSERALMASIREKLLPLPKETVVYPGHEGATSIEIERRVHDFEE